MSTLLGVTPHEIDFGEHPKVVSQFVRWWTEHTDYAPLMVDRYELGEIVGQYSVYCPPPDVAILYAWVRACPWDKHSRILLWP